MNWTLMIISSLYSLRYSLDMTEEDDMINCLISIASNFLAMHAFFIIN